jgi:hypothetical protein
VFCPQAAQRPPWRTPAHPPGCSAASIHLELFDVALLEYQLLIV